MNKVSFNVANLQPRIEYYFSLAMQDALRELEGGPADAAAPAPAPAEPAFAEPAHVEPGEEGVPHAEGHEPAILPDADFPLEGRPQIEGFGSRENFFPDED